MSKYIKKVGEYQAPFIGVDYDGDVYAYDVKPKWSAKVGRWLIVPYARLSGYWYIPKGILPKLEPGCLYEVEADCYQMIEGEYIKDNGKGGYDE